MSNIFSENLFVYLFFLFIERGAWESIVRKWNNFIIFCWQIKSSTKGAKFFDLWPNNRGQKSQKQQKSRYALYKNFVNISCFKKQKDSDNDDDAASFKTKKREDFKEGYQNRALGFSPSKHTKNTNWISWERKFDEKEKLVQTTIDDDFFLLLLCLSALLFLSDETGLRLMNVFSFFSAGFYQYENQTFFQCSQ